MPAVVNPGTRNPRLTLVFFMIIFFMEKCRGS
jgi:hypothetical protein